MLANAMNRALYTAGLSPDAIGYVNMHGTGTVVNDTAEASAIRKVFSDQAAPPPCSSTKPVTGHCLGATPAMEAILCLQALRHQTIPPTANCRDQDPECPIDVVPLQARSADLANVTGMDPVHAAHSRKRSGTSRPGRRSAAGACSLSLPRHGLRSAVRANFECQHCSGKRKRVR